MIWPYFKETNLFQIEQLEGVDKSFFRDDIRLTLDYQEDLDFMRALISKRKILLKKVILELEEII